MSASEVKQKMKKIIADPKKTCPDIFSDNKIGVFLVIKNIIFLLPPSVHKESLTE